MQFINENYTYTLSNIKRNKVDLIDIAAYEYDLESKVFHLKSNLLVCKESKRYHLEIYENNTWNIPILSNTIVNLDITVLQLEVSKPKLVNV